MGNLDTGRDHKDSKDTEGRDSRAMGSRAEKEASKDMVNSRDITSSSRQDTTNNRGMANRATDTISNLIPATTNNSSKAIMAKTLSRPISHKEDPIGLANNCNRLYDE